MPKKYSDDQYRKAIDKIKEREKLIKRVSEISRHIEWLTMLREETRTNARRLKSAAIAHDLGVSQSWVEKISERRIER